MVFITNAPRPSEVVARQLDKLHVPREAYDAIVSSGDVTRSVIEAARRAEHVPSSARSATARSLPGSMRISRRWRARTIVVCSGLDDDDIETPDDYRARLETMLKRKLFMVCGNPDVVVERGDKLVYCAGSIADLYATMGGEVLYAGKPYRPIYDLALAKAEAAAGRKAPLERVLAIGDSVRTDLKGARAIGVDFLFVTSGIHAEELGGRERPDSEGAQGDVRRRRRNAEGGDAAVGVVRSLSFPLPQGEREARIRAHYIPIRLQTSKRRPGTPSRSCS